jgi:hypothetical protein
MQIEIVNHFTNTGKEFFRFELYDGPDGIEHVSGFASDLVEAFSKIIEWRERIGQDYYNEINDETDY